MANRDLSLHLKILLYAVFVTIGVFAILIKPFRSTIPLQERSITPTIASESNLLKNNSFETAGSPIANWNLHQAGTAQGSVAQNTTAVDGTYSAKITVTTAEAAAPWNLQFRQSTSISAGQNYTVRFWAKANTARTLHVAVQQSNSPYTNYFVRTINLTTSWQQFSYQFTASATDTVNMQFNAAATIGSVLVDNAQLNLLTPDPTLTPTETSTPQPIITTPPPEPQPNNIPYEQRTITLNTTQASVTLDKQQATNGKVSAPLFEITNDNVTMWNLKAVDPINGYSLNPQTHISTSGDVAQVIVSMPSSNPNGTYSGKVIVQYLKNNAWHDGPLVTYTIRLIGRIASNSVITPTKNTPSPLPRLTTPTPIAAATAKPIQLPNLSILTPDSQQIFFPSKTSLFTWRSDVAGLQTNYTIFKEINFAKKIIMPSVSGPISKVGVNSYELDTSEILPGEYTFSLVASRTSGSADNGGQTLTHPLTLGSKLSLFAAPAIADTYPDIQILIDKSPVKTIYGVQGDARTSQFAQYIYYSSQKIDPAKIGIKLLGDHSNKDDLVIDKIVVDGVEAETQII